jgi:hypothetical protein
VVGRELSLARPTGFCWRIDGEIDEDLISSDAVKQLANQGERETIMADSEPTKEELLKRIAELEQQAQARKPAALEFRVSDKGGISVYGLGRFPVTLYYEQWTRLLGHVDELRTFMEENKSKLKLKPRAGE